MAWARTISVIAGIFCWFAAGAQSDRVHIARGNEWYQQGAFDKAAEAYQKALQENPDNTTAQYNLGAALYKMKQADAAAKAFESVTSVAGDKMLASQSAYNKGVTHSRQKQLQESIQAYKHSLKLNPEDQQARENLQRAINELKKQPPPKQNNNQGQNNNDQKKPEPQRKNNSKINEKQAEQLLNALRQEEQRLQKNRQSKQRSGHMQEKDW